MKIDRKTHKLISGAGAWLMAFAIVLGAFAAHILKGRLDAYSLDVFNKAVDYQFLQAFGLLILPLLANHFSWTDRFLKIVFFLIVSGVLIFSGSLYLLAFTGEKYFGAITPVGGTAMIVAWVLIGSGILRSAD